MRVMSLFDGSCGGMLALQRAGIDVERYEASEIDKYAMQVTKKNFPGVKQLGDICNVKGDKNIDLLIGGSPCQGFSFAGKQLNFRDPRSSLFFEYIRILEESQPNYFFLENVNMKKDYQNVISKMLGVEPIRINSQSLSAHMRDRLYWTNIPFKGDLTDRGIKLQDIIESGYVDREKSFCIDANYFKGGNLKSYEEKKRRQLVYLSEEAYLNRYEWPTDQVYRKLTPLECERLQTVPEGYTEGVSNTQRYKMLGNGWTIDVIAELFKGLK